MEDLPDSNDDRQRALAELAVMINDGSIKAIIDEATGHDPDLAV